MPSAKLKTKQSLTSLNAILKFKLNVVVVRSKQKFNIRIFDRSHPSSNLRHSTVVVVTDMYSNNLDVQI